MKLQDLPHPFENQEKFATINLVQMKSFFSDVAVS